MKQKSSKSWQGNYNRDFAGVSHRDFYYFNK